MIFYKNIVKHTDLPFNEYLQLKGLSHSYLKGEVGGIKKMFNVTDNMRYGSLVDGIITEPWKVDMKDPLYSAARTTAHMLKTKFGDFFKYAQKQISFTAEAHYGGLFIPTTGRLDFLIPGHAVIDLKITQGKDIHGLVEFMGYKNQVWHYSRMANVPTAYLMVHSVPLKMTVIIEPKLDPLYNQFWADKILLHGSVAA